MTAEVINFNERKMERALKRLSDHSRYAFKGGHANRYWKWQSEIPHITATPEKDDDR